MKAQLDKQNGVSNADKSVADNKNGNNKDENKTRKSLIRI